MRVIVIDKDNGGKADALNAGINASTAPYFVSLDADSILDVHALKELMRVLQELPVPCVALAVAMQPHLYIAASAGFPQSADDYTSLCACRERRKTVPRRDLNRAPGEALAPERIAEIRERAASGDKVLPEFDVEICDAAGALVASVRKTVYVRLKPRFRPA